MREKFTQVAKDDKQYNYYERSSDLLYKKRLDLKDLLKRAQEQRKVDKKNNLIIFSGTIFVVVVCYLILSL